MSGCRENERVSEREGVAQLKSIDADGLGDKRLGQVQRHDVCRALPVDGVWLPGGNDEGVSSPEALDDRAAGLRLARDRKLCAL